VERYEYQVVSTPTKRIKFKGLKKTDDAFALTLTENINELAREGWQFVLSETIAETSRSFFGKTRRQERDFMVYRRALRSNGMSVSEVVAPARVRRTDTPSMELVRDRIAEVAVVPVPAIKAVS
jgi:hypothetical protein